MPDKSSIGFVLDFSKKTGDFINISPTDGQVISLAYELLIKNNKKEFLRSEPNNMKECISGKIVDYGHGHIDSQ